MAPLLGPVLSLSTYVCCADEQATGAELHLLIFASYPLDSAKSSQLGSLAGMDQQFGMSVSQLVHT